MKKVVFAILLLGLLLTGTAFGQDMKEADIASHGNLRFSARAGVSYLTGDADELVYLNNVRASELNWDVDSMVMLGVGGTVSFNKWVAVHADYWTNITDGSGEMVDYDWFYAGTYTPTNDNWTDRSDHPDTEASDGSIFDINMEAAAFRNKSGYISGIFGYKRDSIGWDARGGSYIYSTGGGFRNDIGMFPEEELGISYKQTFESMYVGIGLGYTIADFTLTGRVIYCAWTKGEATDYHWVRELRTVDEVDTDMFGVDVTGTYAFTDNFGLQLGFKFTSYEKEKGDSIYTFYGDGAVVELPAGIGMSQETTMVNMALQYTF